MFIGLILFSVIFFFYKWCLLVSFSQLGIEFSCCFCPIDLFAVMCVCVTIHIPDIKDIFNSKNFKFRVYYNTGNDGELLSFHWDIGTHTSTYTHTHTHTWAQPFRAACLTSHSDFLHLGWAVVPEGSLGIWIWQGIPFPWKLGLPSHSQGTACWDSHPFASGFPGEHVHTRWTKEGSPIFPSSHRPTGDEKLLASWYEENEISVDLHQPTALQTWMLAALSISKPSKWSLTFGPWDPMLNSHPFRFDPISSVQRNVKEFYSRPSITHPPPKLNETWGGKTNGEICENGWLRLHLQTEIGNLSV